MIRETEDKKNKKKTNWIYYALIFGPVVHRGLGQ